MIPEDDLELGQLRLLEVDNRVVVPAKTHLRMIVTSADALHSWAVPSSGVKCDAVPLVYCAGDEGAGPHRGAAGPSSIQESDSGSWRQYLHFSSEKDEDFAPEPSTARAPEPATSSEWRGSGLWIEKWVHPESEEVNSFPSTSGRLGAAGSPAPVPPMEAPVPPMEAPVPPLPQVETPGVSEDGIWAALDEGAEPPADIPQLNPPLITDRERFIELHQRFSLYYFGRNEITDLAEFTGRLETYIPIEKRIEAALVFDGYAPDRIRAQIGQIRPILFLHPSRVLLLSERTMGNYLGEMEMNGTRNSTPYTRVVRAIRNRNLIL
jgi:hypothetical protein